jgi:hypothetical protein
MAIDATNGNVGIGTDSPTFGSGSGLEVSRSGTATVRVERTGSTACSGEFFAGNGKVVIGSTSDTHLEFRTNSQEAMRIDSSQNLLVSHTGSVYNNINTNNTVGLSLTENGELFACSSESSGVMILNRKSSNGAIATFRKDGETVGSIGASGGTIYAGKGGSGLIFNDGGTKDLIPYSLTAADTVDNSISLGIASKRFKDLYLSSGVYLGGTGSANHLSDYEEGTCSLKWSDGTNQSSAITGRYTKVGRQVTVSNYVHGSITGLTSSANILIAGFPFPFADYGTFPVVTRNVNAPTGTINLVGFHNNSGQTAQLYFVVDNSDYVPVTVSDMNTGTNDCYFNITYQTS